MKCSFFSIFYWCTVTLNFPSFMKKPGFTLIELLVVITIIGILATGASVAFQVSVAKANDVSRKMFVSNLKVGQLSYEIDFLTFATTKDQLMPYFSSQNLKIPNRNGGSNPPHIAQVLMKISDNKTTFLTVACGMRDGTSPTNGGYTDQFPVMGDVLYNCTHSDQSAVYIPSVANLDESNGTIISFTP